MNVRRIFSIVLLIATLAITPLVALASRAAYTQTITTTPTTVFDQATDDGPAVEIRIGCSPTSANGLLVHVDQLHGTTQYVRLEPGAEMPFRSRRGIRRVVLKGDGGSAVADWAVTEE